MEDTSAPSSLFEQPNPELELIFNSLPDVLIRIKPDGTILNGYGTIDDSLPYTIPDLVGNNMHDFLPEELANYLQTELDGVFAGAEYREIGFSLPSTNGIRYFEARTVPLSGRNELTVIIRDITNQKLTEMELRKNEERYRLISTVASDYMYSTSLNENGELVLNWVAGAFTKITGYTFDDYIAAGGWVARVYPDDLEIDHRDMDKLSHNWPVVSEIRTLHKNGTIVWVRSYAHPIWNVDQNKLIGMYGAVQDITAEKEAEEALKDSEARYRYLFEQNPLPMLIYDCQSCTSRRSMPLLNVTMATPKRRRVSCF